MHLQLTAYGFDFPLLLALRFLHIPLTMVEHSGLDIVYLNKYSNSSSSSSSPEPDKKIFTKLKLSLSGDYPKKNAEILSGQYGINLLLIGAALMLAAAQQNPSVKIEHLQSFTTCLMILQLIWMMWYILVRDRQKSTRTEKDVHAATSWIRGEFVRLRKCAQYVKMKALWEQGHKMFVSQLKKNLKIDHFVSWCS